MKKSPSFFSVQAQGNSMYPLLQDKDTVEYIQMPFRKIKLNDIILVYVDNILMTHRVIYKTKTTCITRGDNNATADTIIQKGRVLAKVVRFKRKGVWYGIQAVYLAQSALYLHEIQKLETVLQFQRIPHVFLKGVLISLRYEGAIPKRIYADCDILVQRNDYKIIEKTFKTLGYQLQERQLSFRATFDNLSVNAGEKSRSVLRFARFFDFAQNDKQDLKVNSGPEVSYMKMVNGVPVVFDVHFEPVFLMTQIGGMNWLYPSKFLIQLGEQIIKRGELKKIKGFSYSLCSPSDQILYLALHIFHHNYTDSVRYQLLDAVIRKSAPAFVKTTAGKQGDWEELGNTIKEYQLEGYVYGVFMLLKKYFKTPIPQSFISEIQPSSFKRRVSTYFLKRVDIFSQDSRVNAGISRFILIFFLSPNPFWKKLLLFIHPEVLYTGARLAFSFLSSRVSQARRRFAQ